MARPHKADEDRRGDHRVRAYLTEREVERLDRRRADRSRSAYLVEQSGLAAPYDLRGLTVQQPWASLLIAGRKPWENRPRDPGIRPGGQWVAIHAGLTLHPGAASAHELAPDLDLSTAPRGAIMGIAWLAPAVTLAEVAARHEWAVGPLCIPVAHPIALAEPIPCRGMLGLWRVPSDIIARIEAEIGAIG